MSLTTQTFSRVEFEDFNPNVISDKQPIWAVYDGQRFKTYATRGPALNAALHHNRTKLYRFNLSTRLWELLAVKDSQNHPSNCDVCGGEYPIPGARNYSSYWAWERGVDGKIPDDPELVFCCSSDCRSVVTR
jgi:hypothetical protein